MHDFPKIIEQRRFICKKCGYNAIVFGEQYFDYGSYNYMATFECQECQTLFEDLVSIVEEWDTSDEFIYGLNENIICLRCSNRKAIVWNLKTGKCPKCSGDMDCIVEGMQRVHGS